MNIHYIIVHSVEFPSMRININYRKKLSYIRKEKKAEILIEEGEKDSFGDSIQTEPSLKLQ